jgi:tetratricopeptide (TPR) repeat protein
MKPLCFIIMPFGKKKDANGNEVDFDYVYNHFIRLVIEKAGLAPIRADEEMMGGIIHKPMYERLILCDYAIADLTTANANVFYELGIRYTAKPFTTFSIFETGTKIPFDLVDVRAFPYTMEDGKIKDLDAKITALVNYVNGMKAQKLPDSPIYQLLDGIQFSHKLPHEKVEMLRNQTAFNESVRNKLDNILQSALPKEEKVAAIGELEASLGDKNDWQTGMCIDILLAYRSAGAAKEMVRFIEAMPAYLAKTVLIQEQYGFALNRAGQKEQAIKVLEKLIAENGLNSETCGILGRVYKDKYNELKTTKPGLADSYLDMAIETYMNGYKADMRDFYPGVNAATLLCIKKDPASADLAKVVEFSVTTYLEKKDRAVAHSRSIDDYWPYATLLELAVMQGNAAKALRYFNKSLTMPNEDWQRKTTADNLQLLAGDTDWVNDIITELKPKEG